MVGTPAYLAPELVQGGTVDPRAELYAVCVVMYKAVTGQSPLQTKRNTADEMIEYLEDSSLPIPSRSLLEFRPDFPASFAQWIEKGLNRNRAVRPASAVDFRNALEKTVAKEALTTNEVKKSPLKRVLSWFAKFRGNS
jgi:serine/threonine protein kinase